MTAADPVMATDQAKPAGQQVIANEPGEARGWLKAAAAPGRGPLRAAAACQVLETVFTIAGWAGLAWIAQGILARGAAPVWAALTLLADGGLLAAAAA